LHRKWLLAIAALALLLRFAYAAASGWPGGVPAAEARRLAASRRDAGAPRLYH